MKTVTTTTTVTTLFKSDAPGSPWSHSMDIDGADVVSIHVEAKGDSLEVEIALANGRHLSVGGWKSYDDFGSEVIEVTKVVTEVDAAPPTTPPNIESDDDLAGVMNAGKDSDVTVQNWQGYDTWTGDGYGIALGFSEPVAEPSDLLAYFFVSNMACGWDGFDSQVPGNPVNPDANGESTVWYWPCDLTKSARDDVAHELGFLRTFMQEGSPVRKTNRNGAKGTRAVIGVGRGIQVFLALDN